MVKLAYTLGSGPSSRKAVEVRLLSGASAFHSAPVVCSRRGIFLCNVSFLSSAMGDPARKSDVVVRRLLECVVNSV